MRRRLPLAVAIAVAIGIGISGAAAAGVFDASTRALGPGARATTSAPATPPMATASAPPDAPASSGVPGVMDDCTAPAAATQLRVEPASIVIACADAGIGARNLSWQRWGATGAYGRGTIWFHVCTPDCASSTTYRRYPAKITLGGVVQTSQGPAFSVMSVTYTRTGPRRSPTGSLVVRFTLEYPGA